jgi:hypothetical protein
MKQTKQQRDAVTFGVAIAIISTIGIVSLIGTAMYYGPEVLGQHPPPIPVLVVIVYNAAWFIGIFMLAVFVPSPPTPAHGTDWMWTHRRD